MLCSSGAGEETCPEICPLTQSLDRLHTQSPACHHLNSVREGRYPETCLLLSGSVGPQTQRPACLHATWYRRGEPSIDPLLPCLKEGYRHQEACLPPSHAMQCRQRSPRGSPATQRLASHMVCLECGSHYNVQVCSGQMGERERSRIVWAL